MKSIRKLRCSRVGAYWLETGKDPKPVFDSILYDWKLPTELFSEIYSTLVDVKCETNPLKYSYGPVPKDGYTMAQIALIVNHRIQVKNGGGRSYIQTKLTENLKAGKNYLGGGYQALQFIDDYAANNLGMLFTPEPVGSDTNLLLSYHPQINQTDVDKDPLIWKKFYGCFTSAGEEQYLTIGGFSDDDHTKLVDLISLRSGQ